MVTTPLVPLVDGDKLVVIASMGGAPKSPAWYHNLVANPTLTVEYGTEKFEATARVAEGAERDALYARQAAAFPPFAEYEKKTTRKIPVIVLTRNHGNT
jgi:deazaflavin-dependent oxidoreductase (nitroreductase family)